MSVDASANERFELDVRIGSVERQVNELSDLRNGYQRSLEHFHAQFRSVSRRRESSLHESMQAGSSVAHRELEEQQELLFHINRYVDDSAEAFDQLNSQVRQALDDERQRLIRAKGELPWE